MDAFRKKGRLRAFTVFELLVVLGVMFVVVALILPNLVRHGPSHHANCVSNLKAVGLAFRLWSGDNGDQYPMAYAGNPLYPLINNGAEWSAAGATAKYQFTVFEAMSNELSTPKVVVCPTDKRVAATNFTTDFNNNHVSFFVGLDASETRPNAFLSGDRNLTNGLPKLNGTLSLQTNQNFGWTKEQHNQMGNIGFGDGSVQQIRNDQIKVFLGKTGLGTNRLMFPE
jgi:prepilin-type processing-associated H-X9-DG protein